MRKIILLLFLTASLALAGDNKIYSNEKASFSIEKDGELNIWKRTKNEFHIKSFSFKHDGKNWQKNLLILEEYEAKTHIGIPTPKSKLRLTAWELTESEVLNKMWIIEEEADTWEDRGSEIILTKHGCCDQPNKQYHFSTVTGKTKK